jgi:uncharacterized protein with HEPN domain
MTGQRTRVVIQHILEDLHDISDFMGDMSRNQFESSALVKKAVVMSLINIGELSRQLPDSVRERHTNVPWQSIVGLRNGAAHGYHVLDPEIVWNIAKYDLAPLEEAIRRELELSK